VVRKDDLLSLVWPDTVVEEGNLAVHVSSLRKALSVHGKSGHIETVPKRGYRFTAPVQPTLKAGAVAPNDANGLFRVAEHYIQQNTVMGSRRAAAMYQRCIENDPLNGKARAGLADSLLLRFIRGDLGWEQGVGAAKALLAEAKEIHSGCADVHISLSRLHCVWDWQWQRARDEVQHGLELATDDGTKLVAETWHGSYLARLGDIDRGLRQLQHASLALPLYSLVWNFLAEAHFLARDFTAAAAVSTEALELHPNCWYHHTMAARALTMLGEYTDALRHLRLAKLLYPETDLGFVAAIAYVHAVAGRRDRAVRLLKRILVEQDGQHASLLSLAMVLAALGDKSRALDNIERACAVHEWYISGLKRDCCVDPLRTDPRFRRVLSQVGI
jgi:tetratricopeptide (TPR) repeat protein